MKLKKTGKLALAVSAALLLLAAKESQASLVWESEAASYNYLVLHNGGQFYQRNSLLNPFNSGFVPPTVGTSDAMKTATSYGMIVTSSPNESPLGSVLAMNAGAYGTGSPLSPPDGLSVKAFAEMTFQGFDDALQGISGGRQQVVASISRRFSVDAPGLYNFAADFSGDINFDDYLTTYVDPFFGMPIRSKAQHLLDVTARLTGFAVNVSGQVMALADGTDLFFDLSEENRSENANLQLRTETAGGDSIFYQMAIAVSINTELDNYALFSTHTSPIESLDANGNGHMFLGTDSAPLTLDASIHPVVATPVPASALLLLSGLSSLAIFRRRKTKE